MKKLLLLLCIFSLHATLSAQVLHRWQTTDSRGDENVEIKMVIFKNNHFAILAKTEQYPFVWYGTWESTDETAFKLTLTTETDPDGNEIPIRNGMFYVVDENTAIVAATSLGFELTRDRSASIKIAEDKIPSDIQVIGDN